MKVQMSLQQTQMDRFYLLISLLWMRSSIRNLARFVEIPYLVSVEDVFQLVGISMVKCAMVAYNTSMVAYAQVLFSLFGDKMADSMDMGGHLYTYNEGRTSYLYFCVVIQNGRTFICWYFNGYGWTFIHIQ
ncbi:hypothetical protein HanPI659440_Chr00c09g0721611 [Helianthus annuus]|nr:hypothetical protein HanPI659440_Chr00c09g0721611 [Helianthus annuus]